MNKLIDLLTGHLEEYGNLPDRIPIKELLDDSRNIPISLFAHRIVLLRCYINPGYYSFEEGRINLI